MQLPLKALTEEFKFTKVKVHMTLRNSKDQVIRDTLPAVKTGRKWSASTVVAEAESSLKLKDIVGATQLDRCGIGHSQVQLWSLSSAKERRELVVEEIR